MTPSDPASRNMAGWSGNATTSLKQEGHVNHKRSVRFYASIAAIAIAGTWLYMQTQPKSATATPIPSPTPTTAVAVLIATPAPRQQIVTMPTAVQAPANICRALGDGPTWVKDSIYKASGWTQAGDGQVRLEEPIGWQPLAFFLCPGINKLAEISYTPPTKTPNPTATAQPTRPAATPTNRPAAPAAQLASLTFQCSPTVPYIINAAAAPLTITTPQDPWTTTLQPRTSFWVNPNGANRFAASAPGYNDLAITTNNTCPGGTIR